MSHLESLVTTQRHRIEGLVHSHERMLRVVASSDLLARATGQFAREPSRHGSDEIRRLLLQWKLDYPGFQNLAILSADGRVMATTDPEHLPAGVAPVLVATHPGAVAAVAASVTDPAAGSADRHRDARIVVSVPWSLVYMRVGQLLAELNFDEFSLITSDYTGMRDTGETVLARRDTDGNAVYLTAVRSNPDASLHRVIPREDRGIAITRALRGEEGVFVDAVDYRGVPVLSATAYLPREDWGIVVKIDRAEALAPLGTLAQGLAVVFALSCLAVVGVGYLFAHRITAPIVRLTRVAEAIDRGDLSQRVTVTSVDEVGVLGHAFNRMTSDLLAANTRLEERVRDRTAALEREMAERALAEHRFQLAFDQGPEPMVMADGGGRILLVNRRLESVFGYGREDLVGRDLDVLFPEHERGALRALGGRLLASPFTGRVETAPRLTGLRRDGSELPIEVGLSLVEAGDGRLVFVVIRDLRERQRSEAAQALLAAVVDSAHDAIIAIGTDMAITTWNAGAEQLYGYCASEIVGQPASLLLPPEEKDQQFWTLRRLMEEGRATHHEARRRRKDGTLVDVALTRSPIRSATGQVLGLSVIARDITARKEAEAIMRASLHEKDVLLKEIHHRVKNNLQIVSSLLNLQAGSAGDPRMTRLMRETQHRVKSMALMHETLYRSGDLAALDLRPYVTALAQYLHHSFGPTLRRVALRLDVEPLLLPIDSAIPCGLILTELVSNAFKYAFPDAATGTLLVEGRHEPDGGYVLRVVDDGRGMPTDVDPAQSRSLGLQLVANLVRQLHAELTRDPVDRGTSFTIRFTELHGAHAAAVDGAA